jgi:hypothetical protein
MSPYDAEGGSGVNALIGRTDGFACSEQSPNVIVNDLRIVGLLYRSLLAQCFGTVDGSRHRTGQQHVETGPIFTYPLCQTKSVDGPWHFNVGENNIDGSFNVKQNRRRFLRIYCFNHFVAAVAKVLRNGHTHQDLVFNEEDCLLLRGLISHRG